MTKNERMLKNAMEQLEEAQKRARTRLYDITDVKEIIEDAQKELEKLDRIEKKYIQKVYFRRVESLTNAYRYRGESTEIEGYINKYGNIEEITICRWTAPKKGSYEIYITEPIFA